jgi:hypothetical protein
MKDRATPVVSAERAGDSNRGNAIDMLGVDDGGDTTSASKGTTGRTGRAGLGAAVESEQSEIRVGLRMESIDELWDTNEEVGSDPSKVSPAPASPTPVKPAPSKSPPIAAPADSRTVSKVQLAAEAFRQKAGIRTPPAVVPMAPPSPAVQEAQVVVSPMVVLEDPLDLQEIKPESEVAAPKPEPTPLPRAPQENVLSLDAGYAVEFFSSAPSAIEQGVELEPDASRGPRHGRTPTQLARQQYLRRLVFKLMLGVIAFVALAILSLWYRGLLRIPR